MRRAFHSALRALPWLAAFTLALAATGCDDDGSGGGPGGSASLEVAGTFDTDFGTTMTLTEDAWGDQVLVGYDNAENLAVTRNPDDAQFGPGTYNRLVWTDREADGASWYYCTVDFNLETEQAAWDSEATADASDPTSAGCGGFPWTKMTPKE